MMEGERRGREQWRGREGGDVGRKEGGRNISWALVVGHMRSPIVGVGSARL